ncbi:hypothetical protein WICMUC_005941 [Wickerhamomyces mucosus]|uniref:Uncharacterized protein n=1 Tax=Wickerhamomyces mucosus TaxID=1378264 RepID=A0A9P8P1I3_9ASCO|nr:hypothetical protein WICMUC_005941 [Wickerhamomyces mucosus]
MSSLPSLKSTYLYNLTDSQFLKSSIVKISNNYRSNISKQLKSSINFQNHLFFNFKKLNKNIKLLNHEIDQFKDKDFANEEKIELNLSLDGLNDEIDLMLEKLNKVVDRLNGNFKDYKLLSQLKKNSEIDQVEQEPSKELNERFKDNIEMEEQTLNDDQDNTINDNTIDNHQISQSTKSSTYKSPNVSTLPHSFLLPRPSTATTSVSTSTTITSAKFV